MIEDEITLYGKRVMPAWETEDCINLIVWCDGCDRWHYHGTGGNNNGNGHRVADCFYESSPYFLGGYYIVRVGKFEELPVEIRRRRKRYTAPGVKPIRPIPDLTRDQIQMIRDYVRREEQ